MSIRHLSTSVFRTLIAFAVFISTATLIAFACAVTRRQITATHLEECVTATIGGQTIQNVIYKYEDNNITFTDGIVKGVRVAGYGFCGSSTVGQSIKCGPEFETPYGGDCSPANSNCVRWRQNVQSKLANCGTFSCSCEDGSFDTIYVEETCPTPAQACQNNGQYWNFSNETCNETPQTCAGSCSPYEGNPPPFQEGTISGPADYCRYEWGCPTDFTDSGGCCVNPSPIVIDVAGDGFSLTDADNGVHFDMGGDGHKELIAWTSVGSDDAWLALDRNGNGQIDNAKELFGNFTAQPHATTFANGFLALAEYDRNENGGNGDGQINNQDAIFRSLYLWQDTNHNGISESNELHTLRDLGLKSVEFDYTESRKTDQYGNKFRFRAKVKDTRDEQIGRWAWDVFLVSK